VFVCGRQLQQEGIGLCISAGVQQLFRRGRNNQ